MFCNHNKVFIYVYVQQNHCSCVINGPLQASQKEEEANGILIWLMTRRAIISENNNGRFCAKINLWDSIFLNFEKLDSLSFQLA